MTKQISIPKRALYELKEELTKVNKKMLKSDNIQISIVSEAERSEERKDDLGFVTVKKFVDLTFDLPIEVFKKEGFKFEGAISLQDGSRAIYSPDNEFHSKFNLDLSFICNHCNTNRYRTFKAIFSNNDQIFQIGRECAKEYFGIDLVGLLEKFEWFIESFGGRDIEEEGRGRISYHKDYMLASLYILNRDKGYISKSRVEGTMNQSTSEMVFELIQYTGNDPIMKEEKVRYHAWIADNKEKVTKDLETIYEFYKNDNPMSTFDWNLKEAVTEGSDRVGLIAYGVYKALREQIDTLKVKVEYVNDVYAKEGDKIEVEVTVEKIIPYESAYGYGSIVKMVTNNGYRLSWFASNNSLEEGFKGTIKATVKGSNEYKGIISTNVTRVRAI